MDNVVLPSLACSISTTKHRALRAAVLDEQLRLCDSGSLLPVSKTPKTRGTKVYTKGVCGSEKPSASSGQKRGLVYTKNACFQVKRRKKTCTPKSLPGVCVEPLRTALVYRFGLPSKTPKSGSGRMWDLGAQGGSAKAPARNNAPGGSTARGSMP